VEEAVAASVSAVTAVMSAIIAAIAVWLSVVLYRGQLREHAQSLHRDLTTGEVEEARRVLGGIVHSGAEITGVSLDNTLSSYFKLLWCFERVYVGRRRIGGAWMVGRGLRKFLDELILWHVDEWDTNLRPVDERGRGLRDRLNSALEETDRSLQDDDSRDAFKKLVADLGPQLRRRRDARERAQRGSSDVAPAGAGAPG
jgi:hypothetical protein